MITIICNGYFEEKQHLIKYMNIPNVLVKGLVKVLYSKYKTRGVVQNSSWSYEVKLKGVF